MPTATINPGRLGLTLHPQTGPNGVQVCTVSQVDRGTPAYQNGIQTHDVLVSVDDVDVQGWRFDSVLVLLKGEAGSWVKMKMYRPYGPYVGFMNFMLQRQDQPGQTFTPPQHPPPRTHTNGFPATSVGDVGQRFGDLSVSGNARNGSFTQDSTTSSYIQVGRDNGLHSPLQQQQHPGIVPAKDCMLPMEGGMTGLANLGNTCFMNAIIQCLVHSLPIATYLIFHLEEDNAVENNGSKAEHDSELVRAFKALFGHLWSGSHASALEPRSLIAAFRADARTKSLFNYKQQDAHELLCLLLDAIHQDTNGMVQSDRNGSETVKRGSGFMGCFGASRRKAQQQPPPPAPELEDWVTEIDPEPVVSKVIESEMTDVDSVVSKFLAGRLCSEVQCKACAYKTQNREGFFTLSLPIPQRRPGQDVTLQDCFRLMEREETSVPWVCDKCKQSGAAKRIWVSSHPKVLIVHLERFGYHNGRKTKRDDTIMIPMRGLTRDDVPVPGEDGTGGRSSVYDMVAWTEHLGSDADGGHYVANCKHLDGHFYRFDDTRVTRAPYTPYVKSNTAYVLFYERRD